MFKFSRTTFQDNQQTFSFRAAVSQCHSVSTVETKTHVNAVQGFVPVSDDHRYGKPTGLPGMGLAGAGTGDYI